MGKAMTAKQILIVEDEKAIRDMIAGLRRAGYDVLEAEDCRTARHKVADRLPDLLLVDWMLPDMSGLELTRALKKDDATREVPVIMLTARAEEDDKIRGLDGGADDYVTSPSRRGNCWPESRPCCGVRTEPVRTRSWTWRVFGWTPDRTGSWWAIGSSRWARRSFACCLSS